MRFAVISVAITIGMTVLSSASTSKLDRYDVVWLTPSKDAAGSMPIGNGEVVLNAWIEAGTGDLLFYIARSDALSEISRILKLGRVRVHFEPSPFKDALDFRQHLHLHDGSIEFSGRGAALQLFVDPDAHVIHLYGTTGQPVSIVATIESWRGAPRTLPQEEMASAWSVHDAPFPLVESADRFLGSHTGVTWCHRNETSVVPKLWENQSLTSLKGTSDPLIHRTFGGMMEGEGFKKTALQTLATPEAIRTVDIRIATYSAQTPSLDVWQSGVEREFAKSPTVAAWDRTKGWWAAFWDRSSFFVTTDDPKQLDTTDLITRGYVLQRFVQACQNRGAYPAKFNGGYYTVEPAASGKPFNADWRAWGDSHWFQNVRHIAHPMLASGDFDMMEPFFRLYETNRTLSESRSQAYHGTQGAYFPETMAVYGTYSGGDYGWDRKGHKPEDVLCPWWQYTRNQGPELVALMLDRWDYTRDSLFLEDRVLPMAESVLRYFDTRFKKDGQRRIVLDPTQSVETYWSGVVNDMPATAGLIAITHRLCSLPPGLLSGSQKAFFERMRKACPDLPLTILDGKQELAPAQKYDPKTSNCENPELYAVWPFRVVSLAHPALLAEGRLAYDHRINKLDVGWGYDGNAAALLGLTDEAARILLVKCKNSNPAYRWPATWGPNFDWLPDQNHGGNLLNTANLMLLQAEPLEAGGAIRILPAWPKMWDVEFTLHAPGLTTVHCLAKGGTILRVEVSPKERAKDVIWPEGWARG